MFYGQKAETGSRVASRMGVRLLGFPARFVPIAMPRTLLPFLATGLLLGAGVATPAPDAGEFTTSTLAAQTNVVFLGIEGDYKEVSVEALTTWFVEDQEQKVIGTPIRAMSDPTRRVWALETEEPKKILRGLKSGLKKQGFQASLLVTTAVEPLEKNARALRTALRTIEQEDKVWTSWNTRGCETIWIFHEKSFDAKKVEGLFRDTEATVAFAHQDVSLAPAHCDDYATMAVELTEKLDALKISTNEDHFVADLFLRDIESFLILRQEGSKEMVLCPSTLLRAVPADQDPATWKVTIDNTGYPFQD